jgi:hypothetical protein
LKRRSPNKGTAQVSKFRMILRHTTRDESGRGRGVIFLWERAGEQGRKPQ